MAGIRQHGLRAILVVCSGYYIPRTRFRSCFIQSVDADQPVQQCITLSIAIVAEEQVERMVKYLKENFFVRYRRFDSFTHVNQQLELFDFTFQPSIAVRLSENWLVWRSWSAAKTFSWWGLLVSEKTSDHSS